MPYEYAGRCHCGAIACTVQSGIRAGDFALRSCDCSFCARHGAVYLSDPAGRLDLRSASTGALIVYRQGSGTARMLACAACATLVGAFLPDGERLYGAVNARCIDDWASLGAVKPIAVGGMSAADKAARWKQVWMPVDFAHAARLA
jgi:hypothetical protein